MVLNGVGGERTTTGNIFEQSKNVFNSLSSIEGFHSKDNVLFFKDNPIAETYDKHKFYVFLNSKGIDWKEILSKQMLPDNTLITDTHVFIFEMKYQQVAGSVDEKLQTCDFKKTQYEKLCKSLNKKVVYCYVLNDWFKDDKYKDTLDYILERNCFYFFNEVPLEFIFEIK